MEQLLNTNAHLLSAQTTILDNEISINDIIDPENRFNVIFDKPQIENGSIPHNEILIRLLESIETIDFRGYLEFNNVNESITKKHFLISVCP